MLTHKKPNFSKLPGGWDVSSNQVKHILNDIIYSQPAINFNGVKIIKNCLKNSECDQLIDLILSSPNFENVSARGYKESQENLKINLVSGLGTEIGSIRTSIWSENLAISLWNKKLAHHFSDSILCNQFTPTDWWQGDKARFLWDPYGVSPLFRCMKYSNGGKHYPHYDAGFIYEDDNYRTLFSFVLYLTNNSTGFTRIIDDEQNLIPIWNRNHEDWITNDVSSNKVLAKIKPVKGDMLIFPHRLCHDVEEFTALDNEKERIIIRGDIICNHSKARQEFLFP